MLLAGQPLLLRDGGRCAADGRDRARNELMDGGIDGSMAAWNGMRETKWTDGRTDAWRDGWTDECLIDCMNACMDELNEWMDGMS